MNKLRDNWKYNEALELFEQLLKKYEIRWSKNTLVELCILAWKKEKIFDHISKKDYEELETSISLYKYSHFK